MRGVNVGKAEKLGRRIKEGKVGAEGGWGKVKGHVGYKGGRTGYGVL